MTTVVTNTQIRILLQEGVERLRRVGIEHGRHEAEWLLSRLMGMRPLELYTETEDVVVPSSVAERFFAQIEERCVGIPLQYILEEVDFCGAIFEVAPGVFIPRPETETLIEIACEALQVQERGLGRPLRVLDVGTGSGCIALTLARRLPTCVVVGVELSWDALEVARRNTLRQGLTSRVWLVQGRWLQAIGGMYDAIVSNPPYVPSAQVDHLPLDVRHEPRLSLDGGQDGLRDVWQLLGQASRVLRPGGLLLMECAEEQVERILQHGKTLEWVEGLKPLVDLTERPRGVLITRTHKSDYSD